MRTAFRLENLLPQLPGDLTDAIHRVAKEEGHTTEALRVCRATHSEKAKTGQGDLGPRTAVRYVSTRTIDRDNEVVVPKGVMLKDFEKSGQFLWGHNYSLPPLGSDNWIKADDWGIMAESVYGDTGDGTLAEVVWRLVQQGHQKTSSIGFVPLAWTEPGHNDWEKTITKLGNDWREFSKVADKVERVITKSVLLEHSDVAVPANPDATMVAVAKQFTDDAKVLGYLGITEPPDAKSEPEPGPEPAPTEPQAEPANKRAIPYSIHGDGPKAARETAWNGPREVAAADVKALRKMCAWEDAEEPSLKSGYKLPHHLAAGKHAVVWRGVTAAMAALLGARGGVDLPSADRRGCYDHLAKHYADFDATPPELRWYPQGELKQLFPWLYDSEPIRVVSRGPVVPAKCGVRVVAAPLSQTADEVIRRAVQDALDIRRGRV